MEAAVEAEDTKKAEEGLDEKEVHRKE